MKKFIETILNIYNIEELRGRILTTLTLLLVYRLGAQVVYQESIPSNYPNFLIEPMAVDF